MVTYTSENQQQAARKHCQVRDVPLIFWKGQCVRVAFFPLPDSQNWDVRLSLNPTDFHPAHNGAAARWQSNSDNRKIKAMKCSAWWITYFKQDLRSLRVDFRSTLEWSEAMAAWETETQSWKKVWGKCSEVTWNVCMIWSFNSWSSAYAVSFPVGFFFSPLSCSP